MPDEQTTSGDSKGSILDYFKELADQQKSWAPAMWGGGLGLASGALMTRERPGENARQRAWRTLRNAAVSGALGGFGAQAVMHGGKEVADATGLADIINPPPPEPKGPGAWNSTMRFLQSPLGAIGLAGGTRAAIGRTPPIGGAGGGSANSRIAAFEGLFKDQRGQLINRNIGPVITKKLFPDDWKTLSKAQKLREIKNYMTFARQQQPNPAGLRAPGTPSVSGSSLLRDAAAVSSSGARLTETARERLMNQLGLGSKSHTAVRGLSRALIPHARFSTHRGWKTFHGGKNLAPTGGAVALPHWLEGAEESSGSLLQDVAKGVTGEWTEGGDPPAAPPAPEGAWNFIKSIPGRVWDGATTPVGDLIPASDAPAAAPEKRKLEEIIEAAKKLNTENIS